MNYPLTGAPNQRLELQKLPLQLYVLLSLPYAIPWILFAFGIVIPKFLFVATCVFVVQAVALVVAALRNYVALHVDHIEVSQFYFFQGRKCDIPFNKVVRLDVDNVSGTVGIWFEDAAGEGDKVELALSNRLSASTLSDVIRTRNSNVNVAGELEDGKSPEQSVREVFPTEDKRLRIGVDRSQVLPWVLGGMFVTPFMSAAIHFTGGEFSVFRWLGLTLFVWGFIAFFYFGGMWKTFVYLHSDRVDIRSGLFDERHRIAYESVVEAKGSQTGLLEVIYRKGGFAGFGKGVGEASIIVSPHSKAPIVAALVNEGRDRAHTNKSSALLS